MHQLAVYTDVGCGDLDCRMGMRRRSPEYFVGSPTRQVPGAAGALLVLDHPVKLSNICTSTISVFPFPFFRAQARGIGEASVLSRI